MLREIGLSFDDFRDEYDFMLVSMLFIVL